MTRVLPPHVALYGVIMMAGATGFLWTETGTLDRTTLLAAFMTASVATTAYAAIGLIASMRRKP
ncbi:hypothetical protein [Jannaschia aquimarina]|uniref:Uncharacterized protein n=1 Tax=Jannaschia aquimarina TaxID=935700 RepID=A0A0D1EJ14_9RHOB|nr:hypothetical protein [Jannaschia aquimarina]KIT16936.1 hypothetical protein jaqu_14350 [Jannaschia aquimarina]SNT11223.1 hypothetical protein SAMN05421775_10613 [Jannaschia aquimarina]